MNAKDYLEDTTIDKETAAYVIVGSNDWGSETIKDGYEAQARVREIIEKKDIKKTYCEVFEKNERNDF